MGSETARRETMAGVVSVNVATVRTGDWTGYVGQTGIDKRPVTGPVWVRELGLDGDTICDRRNHGGVDRAVYAYSADDYEWWQQRMGRVLAPGSFGENLTVAGIDVTGARVGERWSIGSTLLEVTAPRIPCRVFAGFWDVPDLIKVFTERGRPGAYLRVITEGTLASGDSVTVVDRPATLTVGEAFRAMTTEPALLPRLAEAAAYLPTDIREKTLRRLARPTVNPVAGVSGG